MNDFAHQTAFIASAVERILTLLDNDPWSPTYGCAHPAYWRDKTSEVADSRRQEVMLPLALLYRREYPGSNWLGDARLLKGVSALLNFWLLNQYDDGSMDEWYKGERAFAAAAFSTFAVARTLDLLANQLAPELIARAKKGLARSAGWLTQRNDLFKANHQAVGVAALAWASHVLEDSALKSAACNKLKSLLAVQTPEGWFPELGHVDPGYTFLTVEYVAMAMALWQEWDALPFMMRAMDFACGWVHPDLTLGEEYGVCHNPYVSRIAAVLMASSSPLAARLVERCRTQSTGFAGLAPTLGDDLRLTRWAFQPLLAWDYWSGQEPAAPGAMITPHPLPLEPDGHHALLLREAGLARLDLGQDCAVVAPVAGGLIRLFSSTGAIFTDGGYVLTTEGVIATHLGYERLRPLLQEGETLEMTVLLSPVRKFFPSFWQRLILRLVCTTATGSRLARNGIDLIRRSKATPINQSSANLGGRKSPWRLTRRVIPSTLGLEIQDRLVFDRPVSTEGLSLYLRETDQPWQTRPIREFLPNLPATLNGLTWNRIVRRDGERWVMEIA
ncbi:MAG: hypothetical protein H7839_05955 [Magnetococcus sp. YQC-5]